MRKRYKRMINSCLPSTRLHDVWSKQKLKQPNSACRAMYLTTTHFRLRNHIPDDMSYTKQHRFCLLLLLSSFPRRIRRKITALRHSIVKNLPSPWVMVRWIINRSRFSSSFTDFALDSIESFDETLFGCSSINFLFSMAVSISLVSVKA